MNCETCGHYELKKMVTSGKTYSYSGDIPCFNCSRFRQLQDLHTNKNLYGIHGLNMASQQHSNPDQFILNTVKGNL